MSSVLLYTSIFGPYDELNEVPVQTIAHDTRCYTDQDFQSVTWQIARKDLKFNHDPILTARYYKLGQVISDYEFCVYLDGSLRITRADFLQFMLSNLNDHQIVFFKHPHRNCLYDEAEACLTIAKCNHADIRTQITKYAKNDMPRNYGLWANGCFAFRNVRSVSEFRHAWWQEVSKMSTRDQISLPYIIRQTGFAENIKTVDEDVFDNKYIYWVGHRV